ncbi:hypothetical protein FBY33_0093 [Arthrobacter sp. SLBN-112]|jgi:hypothetical protein|uniref:hypothetical protein n=1 Tax=Arthrobacter sp. SLBN-112 TaxID=2768452 RepID=UPI0011510975|nr:hypothetical protein [Arthrobacter sp. SLBN-112]TQJ38101.1 hypothetical protein FBY33_0093 [Arthrobacter sp. SLBN-112]
MSYIPVSRRTIRRHRESERSTRRLVAALSAGAVGAWLLSVLLSAAVFVDGYVHSIDLVVHDLFLVVAFGAIILVDWHGFLWLIGRRTLREIIRLDGAATPLIWGGLFGMLATGVFLSPHLENPMTDVKLAAVLVLSLNGIMLIPLMRRLARLPAEATFRDLTLGQRTHLVSCLVVSQLCWWTAIIIGFINAQS